MYCVPSISRVNYLPNCRVQFIHLKNLWCRNWTRESLLAVSHRDWLLMFSVRWVFTLFIFINFMFFYSVCGGTICDMRNKTIITFVENINCWLLEFLTWQFTNKNEKIINVSLWYIHCILFLFFFLCHPVKCSRKGRNLWGCSESGQKTESP